MFTGIISATAKVSKIFRSKDGLVLETLKPEAWEVKAGSSVAVNGVCSTVKRSSSDLVFEYMPETLSKSNLSELQENSIVNLEQSLLVSDRLDGHIVLGHVDCTGVIKSIETEGNSSVFTFEVFESENMKLIAEKGSIALEGVSLTVVEVKENRFSVKIIPYTMEHTNLKDKKMGMSINIEFDVLAKYLQRMIRK